MLASHGIHPVLARILVVRGVVRPDEPSAELTDLLPPAQLKGVNDAARYLADTVTAKERLLIVIDYDCDDVIACTVGVYDLCILGAQISYIIPNRSEYGYGLSPEIVALVAHKEPGVLATVGNGIADMAGVAVVSVLDTNVAATDHHMSGVQLPKARVIVNPSQPGCGFPSKNLAGVGVTFCVLLVLHTELCKRGVFMPQGQPRLDVLLDLVALGTMVDVVKLDTNNRLLVAQGLKRMRTGRMCPGIATLFHVADRETCRVSTFDLGFGLDPRLNAVG